MMEFHLMRPEWLWGLVPALALFVLLWRQRGRSGSWTSVISPELLPHLIGEKAAPRRVNLLPVVLIGWALGIVAASGPSWNKIPQPIHQKQDALVLVLDLSYSMKAPDLAPTRLDRARQKLLDLLRLRKEGQTALIAYAGDSHIVTPLTDDTPTIANLLPALNPDMMPVPGSSPADAVSQAVGLMHSAGIRQGKILMVTDGVSEKESKDIGTALSGTGMQFSVMGVGTATGAPIPLPRGGFLKDNAGTIVMPTLQDKSLQELAQRNGGRYRRMQIDNSDLDYLLADTGLPETDQTMALDRSADTWDDQGYLLVLCLLPLALGLFRRGWMLCLLPLLLLTAQPQPAVAGAWEDLWLTRDQQGTRALQRGDTEAAAELFENADWAGTAAYRGEDYESAGEHFSSNESADGWYNRGNALAKSGQLDEAIEAYRESLALEPDQTDAMDNIELLEQLKQEQEQQEQDQQDQQQEQDQEQEQNGDNEEEQENNENQGQDQQQDQDQSGQESQQDDNDGEQQDQQSQSENEPQSDEQPAEPQEPEDAASQPEEQDEAAAEQQAQANAADPEEQERDQAMEQWLRRVPDDPSGLLREKFRYESRQRQEQGKRRESETVW